MPRQVLIVGGDSEIATATAAHLRAAGVDVAATTRRPERVAADRPFLDLAQPIADWPIQAGIGAACFCAAIARLADCARHPEDSARVNVAATTGLADRLVASGIPVLFLSTDKVFDGSRPHLPAETPPCPVSEYGRQKAAAEAALAERMAAGEPVRAFFDMMMAPTPVGIVATAIERLLAEPARGIFQLTGPRDIAYSEVAAYLARKLGAEPELVRPVSAYSAGLPPGSTAPHTTLDSSALRRRFGIAVPEPWEVIDELIETGRHGALAAASRHQQAQR